MVSASLWQLLLCWDHKKNMLWSQESKTEKMHGVLRLKKWLKKNDNPEGNLDRNQTE